MTAAATPIPRSSLHDGLVELIRNLITEGELPVGQRISEMALCERYGVSRTPLREALKVLANEGLVNLMPNRGAVVSKLDVGDIRNIFPVLGALERLAGELAAANASPEQIAAIRGLHRDMVQCFQGGDLSGYFKLNQAIHERIIEAAGNPTLTQTHRALSGRVRRSRYLANLSRARWEQAIVEHQNILSALEARDGQRLADVLQSHLNSKAESIIVHMQEQASLEKA